MQIKQGAILALVAAAPAFAQSTVSFESMGWQDFGTSDEVGVTGNFRPGWTHINATPDLGSNLFGVPNQTLSGAADDAAIWFNHYDAVRNSSINEAARLSLSGFTVGQVYELSFFATILRQTSAGWNGNDEVFEVAIAGADLSTWTTSVLSDAVEGDGMNEWVAQSITFTAMNDTVNFSFGENAVAPDISGTHRIGFDGFNARLVPAPTSATLIAIGALTAARRRRS